MGSGEGSRQAPEVALPEGRAVTSLVIDRLCKNFGGLQALHDITPLPSYRIAQMPEPRSVTRISSSWTSRLKVWHPFWYESWGA